MTDFLFDGPAKAETTILLAHGAGAPMDSAAMTAAAKAGPAYPDLRTNVASLESELAATKQALAAKAADPEYLNYTARTKELEGVLASSWEVLENGKLIRMKLKPGVKFSNGSPLNADAVKDSFVEICKPKSAAASDVGGLVGCRDRSVPLGIRVVDETTLEFSLNASPTLFLYQLGSPRAGIVRYTAQGLVGFDETLKQLQGLAA